LQLRRNTGVCAFMQLWAAYVLSMVFGNRCPEPLGVDAFPEQTPCLEGLLLEWSAAAIGGSKFDKHGFVMIGVLIPGDLGWRISNTMLIRHEALVIPPGSTSPELDFMPLPT